MAIAISLYLFMILFVKEIILKYFLIRNRKLMFLTPAIAMSRPHCIRVTQTR